MGQCCTNQEKELEVHKTSSLGKVHVVSSSKDPQDGLQMSVDEENSLEEAQHGPSEQLAIKIRGLPAHLNEKLNRLAKNYPKFDFSAEHDNAMVDKAIFLGMRQFENQSIYIGQWFEKKRNGRGQQIYPDGSVYEGYWLDDKREGHGRFIDYLGDVYEGSWKDDAAEGIGKYTQKGGAYYYGDWVNNKQTGRGKEKWPNGETYEGDYKDGFKHGIGTFKVSDGSYYHGEFVLDKIEGKGTPRSAGEYHWEDGRHYNGSWKNCERSGRGEFFWPTGIRYVGEYRENNKHGRGKVYFENEQFIDGEFRENLLVAAREQEGECVFFSEGKNYLLTFSRGLLNRNKSVSLVGRTQSTPLSAAEQEKVFEKVNGLLEKMSDEEEDIEYVGDSMLHGYSILR